MGFKLNPITGQFDLVGSGGGSGANTTLSNLGTTAINANLIFATDASAHMLATAQTSGATASDQLDVGTGVTVAGNSGILTLYTGDTDDGVTGDIFIFTGYANGTGSRGNISIDANKLDMSAVAQGMTVPVIAGDPSAPANGDVWYNSSTHKLRVRANGVSTDLH